MVRRTLLIAWMMAGATAWAQAPPTPSATYVPGTARTGVAVTCPASSGSPARVIPANTPIPDSLLHASEAQQIAYFCGSGAQPGAAGSTGNPVGDALNLGANIWIEQHIQNPYSAQFATSFTHGFLTGLFSGSTPEAERQRQLALANLQQQQQLAAEQARQIEQAKIDGMFARLDAELKLSGTDAPLELKLESGAPPLTMKLGDDSSGCSGGGIAGLPGIYLQDCSSDSAAQLARRAVALEGPEREVAEDAALQAAAKVPVLAAPSTDPFVADYQQQAQAYVAAAQQQQSALQQASEASGHSQADQSAVTYAQGQVAAAGDAVAAQQSLQHMIAISQTDEDAAVAARQAFEQSDVQLTVARERAADSLAGLAPPVVQVRAAPLADPTLPRTVSAAPAVRTVLPHAMAAAPMSRATAPNTAAPAPAPVHESTQACLGVVEPTIGASVSLDNLNKELDHDMTAYNRLEQAEESQRERRAEWMGEMHEAAQDAAWGLIDKGAEGVLKSSKDELEASNKALQQEMQPVEQEIAAFRQEVAATPAGAAADPAQIASYQNRTQHYREQAQALIERREQIEEGLAQVEVGETILNRFTQARDFAISVARGDSDEEMLKDSMKKSALAVADLTPAGEAIGFGSLAVDVGYDLAVGFIGYDQLRRMNENGAKFDTARRMLTARIARTTAAVACYQAAR